LIDEPGQPEVTLDLRASLRVPGTDVTINVDGLTVVAQSTSAPCGDALGTWWVLTVPKLSAQQSGATFTVARSELAFTSLAATEQQAGGLDWLCPTAP
jgi:hypothetical protein